jgi:hypothetical protein
MLVLVNLRGGVHRARQDLDSGYWASEGMDELGDDVGNGDVASEGVSGTPELGVAGTGVADSVALAAGSVLLASPHQHLYFQSEENVGRKQEGQAPSLHEHRYADNDNLENKIKAAKRPFSTMTHVSHSCSYIAVYMSQPGKHRVATFDQLRGRPNRPTKGHGA